VRRKVALLGHRTHLYEPLTALENLVVRARFLGADSRRGALLSRLEEVGLADRGDDPVQSFSAGMRQRLALASVLQQQARWCCSTSPTVIWIRRASCSWMACCNGCGGKAQRADGTHLVTRAGIS